MTTTTTPPRTRPDDMRRNLAWLAAHPDLAAYAYSTTTTTHRLDGVLVRIVVEADQ